MSHGIDPTGKLASWILNISGWVLRGSGIKSFHELFPFLWKIPAIFCLSFFSITRQVFFPTALMFSTFELLFLVDQKFLLNRKITPQPFVSSLKKLERTSDQPRTLTFLNYIFFIKKVIFFRKLHMLVLFECKLFSRPQTSRTAIQKLLAWNSFLKP